MWRPKTYQLTYFSKSNHLWIYGSWGRAWSLQWDLISQWLFFQPSHNSSSRHNQEIYCKYSAPKVTSNTPQCWLEFFCSILDTSVHFFLNFLPPNKMCPIKVSVPNPSFPRRPPSSTVPKLKSAIFWKLGPKNSEISPSVLLNRSPLRLDLRKVSMSFHTVQWKHHLHRFPAPTILPRVKWSWRFQLLRCFFHDLCGFQVAKNVPRTMANAMDFPLKSIRCPKGFRVAQKQIWGGFSPKPRFLLTPNSSKSFESFLHLQSHHIRRRKCLKNCL